MRQFAREVAGWVAREPGEPMPELSEFSEVLLDHVSAPKTFFDNEEIHLITTASIAHMRSKNPDASRDIRRFRPNFFIETDAGLDGPVENEWVGKALRVGSATLEISARTPRCSMTQRLRPVPR